MDDTQALEKLRATLYGDRPAPRPRHNNRVRLDDLADFLAEHPDCRAPQGRLMFCARCGRQLAGGEFRVCYQVGWLCGPCYQALSLAPLGARCIYCKQTIAIGDWHYKLHSIIANGDGDLQHYFVHLDCEKEWA